MSNLLYFIQVDDRFFVKDIMLKLYAPQTDSNQILFWCMISFYGFIWSQWIKQDIMNIE